MGRAWNIAGSAAFGGMVGFFLGGPLRSGIGGTAGAIATALAVLAGAAAGAGAAIVGERIRRQRDAAFAEFARRRGWEHRDRSDQRLARGIEAYLPFRSGHTVGVEQTLTGRAEGVVFHLLDARYDTGGGKSRTTHRVRAVVLGMPAVGVLSVQRETFAHKVADTFGGEDIDFESAEFSRRFWVKATDRRFAYDVLHPAALEALLAIGDDWTWHWQGAWLVASSSGRLEVAECDGVLAMGLRFARLVPRHVVRDPARQGWTTVPFARS